MAIWMMPPESDGAAGGGNFAVPAPSSILEGMKITVDGAHGRPFLFTNKRGAYLAGQTTGRSHDPGLTVYGRKVLEDYVLSVGGKRLDRESAGSVDMYPYGLVRYYPGGIREELTLLDGLDALVITITGAQEAELTPLVTGGTAEDFEIDRSGGRLLVTPHTGKDILQETPRTVAVTGIRPGQWKVAEPAGLPPGRYAAGGIEETGSLGFVIVVGSNAAEAATLAERLSTEAPARVAARRARMGRLLADTYVQTTDARFDKALAWIKASGDALVTEHTGTDHAGTGIWAGLTWFNNYWGRDTFISLPGIALVTGHLDEAKSILESFAKYQERDEANPLYGKVPNLVASPTNIIYNTADGTPWFVREAWEYIVYSGDQGFAKEIYPAVKRATEGTLKYRVDGNGLLTHGDADTWMDARLEGRDAFSPRGDRAVDIQALWYAQLDASARLARLSGDVASAERWKKAADRLAAAFRKMYRDETTGVLYDHLTPDGTPNRQVRPNEIFALTVPLKPLLDRQEGAPVVRQVVGELTYPYGVATLSQTDPNFHPYHHDPRWFFDSAYHNGTVWPWLAGPVITALTRYGRADMAFELTNAMADQALDLGTVGTISELIDAIPHDDRIKLSGAQSQAWSVAEFVRNVYQDYLGVRPDGPDGVLRLEPHLPMALGEVRAVIPFKKERIKVTYRPGGAVELFADRLEEPVQVAIGDGKPVTLEAGKELALEVPKGNGDELEGLKFAVPQIFPGLKVMEAKGVTAEALTFADAAAAEPAGAKVLYEAANGKGNDRGPNGRYTYPTDSHFAPGILDLTGLRVTADKERYYFTVRFRKLVDPGWHPELGFQLTYAAIAVRTGTGGGAVEIGKEAHYALPPWDAYQRIIYVGGGLEVADAQGRTLATYWPESNEAAFGDAHASCVRFSIPRRLLGDYGPGWRFSAVSGAQDDGGNGGLGVFREVKPVAEPWAGGGADPGGAAPRVYGVLLPRTK